MHASWLSMEERVVMKITKLICEPFHSLYVSLEKDLNEERPLKKIAL